MKRKLIELIEQLDDDKLFRLVYVFINAYIQPSERGKQNDKN